LPIIREAVANYFQQEPKADVDPDEVVSMGAAIHAASLVNSERDAFLLDVTPLDLRIGIAGGLAEPIIERNTPVPIEQSRNFSPFEDHQESVTLKVYQGDSRRADENELLGQFEFSGFAPGLRSETSIEVRFEINADGIVNVIARDPSSGQEASTEITLSSGLSETEKQTIVERDRVSLVQTAVSPESDDLFGDEKAEDTCDSLVPLGDDELDVLDGLSDEDLREMQDELDEEDTLADLMEDEPAAPAIGRVALKTVAVGSPAITAPDSGDGPSERAEALEANVETDPNEGFFDGGDEIDLSGDPDDTHQE